MKAGLSLEKPTREEAEKALAKYPFFAMARMMVAKVASKEGDPRASGLRFLASLYAPHRQYYAFFMGDRVRPIVGPPPRLGGHEPQVPRQSPPKEEKGTSSSPEEPGPAEAMPFSPEYIPRLQGKLKARLTLYRGLTERLRQAIRLPPLPESVTPSEPTPITSTPPTEMWLEPPVLTPDEPASPSPEVPMPAEPTSMPSVSHPEVWHEPLKSAVTDPSAPLPSAEPTSTPTPVLPDLELPSDSSSASIHSQLSKLSPTLLTLQFELPVGRVAPSTHSGEVKEAQVSSDSSSDVIPSEAPEAVSALSRTYFPLETPDAPVSVLREALPEEKTPPIVQEAPAMAEPITETPLSAFTRPYVPLEVPQEGASVHLPDSSSEVPTEEASIVPSIFQSENPIRLSLMPDFDVAGSVHLPVPEPSEMPLTPISKMAAPPSSSLPEPVTSAASTLSPAWRSFLSEIEKPLTEAAQTGLLETAHTLERLRYAFIRYLLEKRHQRSPTSEPPPPSTAIEEVLRLLETFQPKASDTAEAPPLLAVPETEPTGSPPVIYTETMARLCWSQGDLALAIEIYEKLKVKHPEKLAHYESQIARIRKGERP